MSDNILSVIPADPHWQPAPEAADRTVAIVAELVPALADGFAEVEVSWHDAVAIVDCGANLERIGCPRCAGSVGIDWWNELLETRADDGLATLLAHVPCCGAELSIDTLEYEWPCGFARFEIAVWNPGRDWFTGEELTALADALGRPVRQVLAHI
ncbi:hypothetical protein GCM10011583_35560 [Streptomyces camponoticapitis]|uniref:Uncharacterized protein n=1 Tax=Streptomyces camponoticapitis TaxID=1616125 RepID=A0ABQ2E9D2_9ACTN|nr:hypothetical protein [Streptomyces camponoticapitis]GGK01004.1 hypothetical protein GCM10011583_35560 [Streptomyces camponoticapitis]